jgi:hypothetical protein
MVSQGFSGGRGPREVGFGGRILVSGLPGAQPKPVQRHGPIIPQRATPVGWPTPVHHLCQPLLQLRAAGEAGEIVLVSHSADRKKKRHFSPRRRLPQHAAAAGERGAQHGVTRLRAAWTGRAGWVTLRTHGFAGSGASGRPVGKSWGDPVGNLGNVSIILAAF